MTTQVHTPAQRIALAATGYLLIALAPFWLKGGSPMILGAMVVYFVFALRLLKATLPMASRPPKREGHPVQEGKADRLLRRGRRLSYNQI
jgi:hypothetical protein